MAQNNPLYPFKKIMIKSKTKITKTPFFKNIEQDFSCQYAVRIKPKIQQAYHPLD
ncbi:hypothetical protein [Helicobacter pylori]|uniref:hypothetical protein n=1 Tax=Helicobacter pylori TaxID=210 RepID=UPI0012FEA33E|nr:hypothetical protein [Helicobacter pylori]